MSMHAGESLHQNSQEAEHSTKEAEIGIKAIGTMSSRDGKRRGSSLQEGAVLRDHAKTLACFARRILPYGET